MWHACVRSVRGSLVCMVVLVCVCACVRVCVCVCVCVCVLTQQRMCACVANFGCVRASSRTLACLLAGVVVASWLVGGDNRSWMDFRRIEKTSSCVCNSSSCSSSRTRCASAKPTKLAGRKSTMRSPQPSDCGPRWSCCALMVVLCEYTSNTHTHLHWTDYIVGWQCRWVGGWHR